MNKFFYRVYDSYFKTKSINNKVKNEKNIPKTVEESAILELYRLDTFYKIMIPSIFFMEVVLLYKHRLEVIEIISNLSQMFSIDKKWISVSIIIFMFLISTMITNYTDIANQLYRRVWVEIKKLLVKYFLKHSYYMELICHGDEEFRKALMWCRKSINLKDKCEEKFKKYTITACDNYFVIKFNEESSENIADKIQYRKYKILFDEFLSVSEEGFYYFSNYNIFDFLSKEEIMDMSKFPYELSYRPIELVISDLKEKKWIDLK